MRPFRLEMISSWTKAVLVIDLTGLLKVKSESISNPIFPTLPLVFVFRDSQSSVSSLPKRNSATTVACKDVADVNRPASAGVIKNVTFTGGTMSFLL